MNILADESLDGPIIDWLRSIGHNVIAIAEQSPGRSDIKVIDEAIQSGRVLVTSDRDFGELAFRFAKRPRGIALLRIRTPSAETYLRVFQTHWPAIEMKIDGHFVVVSRGRIRTRPLIDPSSEAPKPSTP